MDIHYVSSVIPFYLQLTHLNLDIHYVSHYPLLHAVHCILTWTPTVRFLLSPSICSQLVLTWTSTMCFLLSPSTHSPPHLGVYIHQASSAISFYKQSTTILAHATCFLPFHSAHSFFFFLRECLTTEWQSPTALPVYILVFCL